MSKTFSQHKKELEKERSTILNRITNTNRILKRTQKEKKTTMSSLYAINGQINQRKQLVGVIGKELRLLDESIGENQAIIASLEKDLAELKHEYGIMLYLAYKNNSRYEKLSLLLASNSINELLARLRYFQKYNLLRREQIKQIEYVRENLRKRTAQLQENKVEKQELLKVQKKEEQELASLRVKQKQILQNFKIKESKLQADLKKERKILKEVDNLISKAINNSEFSASLSASEKMTSTSFAKSKGRIVWPVKNGFISAHFGVQPYLPEEEGKPVVKIEKLGIDIQTQPNEPVRSVFAGKVVDVSEIAGRGYLVIIQHGDYFTVYSRLKSVKIKTGDKVSAKQPIGAAGNYKDETYEIEFQIWRHQEKLNPEQWLRK
ncbi:murein hydrolase activator EnvC family protein [Bernardetia sp.]|uniref:murein hydrolase activator EnvC family protein n=1 Tax=Bernardetia sp. TaxID=1937974 RepID=UPI0025C2086E|nr:peptidoglycan DD-metalloendopeptidase family protein [Bernardetia sp.]